MDETITGFKPDNRILPQNGRGVNAPCPIDKKQESKSSGGEPVFSGYFFKVPDELIGLLDTLTPAELKTYLVALHGMQKDKNKGQLSVRQVADRAKVSAQHVQPALKRLTERRWLKFAGDREPERGKTITYDIPFAWKTRSETPPDCTPVGEQSNLQGVQECPPVGAQDCTPVGEQHLESLESIEKTSSSSGSSEQPKRTEDEDDAVLKPYLHEWMKNLHWRDGGFPEPLAADLKAIRAEAHRWTDQQIVEGFKQNAISRAPSDKNPPAGYRYFATVMRNYFKECDGVAPKIDTPTASPSGPMAVIQRMRGRLATMADLDEVDSHTTEARYTCGYCNDTGVMNGRKQLCQACVVGQDRIARQKQEQAEKARFEADKKLREQQTREWDAIRLQQSDAIRRRMTETSGDFWVMETDERAETLKQFRDGTHPLLNKASPMPMVVEQGTKQAATAA